MHRQENVHLRVGRPLQQVHSAPVLNGVDAAPVIVEEVEHTGGVVDGALRPTAEHGLLLGGALEDVHQSEVASGRGQQWEVGTRVADVERFRLFHGNVQIVDIHIKSHWRQEVVLREGILG